MGAGVSTRSTDRQRELDRRTGPGPGADTTRSSAATGEPSAAGDGDGDQTPTVTGISSTPPTATAHGPQAPETAAADVVPTTHGIGGFETAADGLLNHRWAQGSRQDRPTDSGNSTDEPDLDLGRHHKE
jgi:hypothetical protein